MVLRKKKSSRTLLKKPTLLSKSKSSHHFEDQMHIKSPRRSNSKKKERISLPINRYDQSEEDSTTFDIEAAEDIEDRKKYLRRTRTQVFTDSGHDRRRKTTMDPDSLLFSYTQRVKTSRSSKNDWLRKLRKQKNQVSINSFEDYINHPQLIFDQDEDRYILSGFSFKKGVEYILKYSDTESLLITLFLTHSIISPPKKLFSLLLYFFEKFEKKDLKQLSEKVILSIELWYSCNYSDFLSTKMNGKISDLFAELQFGNEKERTWLRVISESWALRSREHSILNDFYSFTCFPSPVLHILKYSSLELAEQITYIDMKHFFKLSPCELLDFDNWENSEVCPNIVEMTEWYNKLAQWVPSVILQQETEKNRVKVIKKITSVAEKCLSLQNYNSLIAITSGLSNFTISGIVSSVGKDRVQKLFDITSPSNGFNNLRTEYESAVVPFVPPQVLIFRDLTQIHLANDTLVSEGIYNVEKLVLLGKIIANLEHSKRYNYTNIEPINNVIHMLENLKPIFDDETLEKLSEIIVQNE
eukprot:TRINITY_DN5174_c0_g1_i1.p1 TRINITY_DN5174_c0_g1~~TRINITY_DN5174_c0_g1_i1.p1  ORF type:complete len:560 (+),score=74.93 TRINITY_DN5174_c0_g1_i1:100-1680(+)